MAGQGLFATGAECVKLWDVSTYMQQHVVHELKSKQGSIVGLCWNRNGQCIASLAEGGDEVFLHAVHKGTSAAIGSIRDIEMPASLDFANGVPHYLGVGSKLGKVVVWDVKRQAERKLFKLPGTGNSVCNINFSATDSHLACGTTKGSMFLLSIRNNTTSGPFTLFNNRLITDLAFSHVKKSVVGASSDEGSIALFDSNASKLVHTFTSAHSAPASAVAFSPINELLMISVGYDRKFACYNMNTKKALTSHRCCAPLTSVNFTNSGSQALLGTMKGQVLVYDLRNFSSPLKIVQAHKGAVKKIKVHLSRAASENSYTSSKSMKQQVSDVSRAVSVSTSEVIFSKEEPLSSDKTPSTSTSVEDTQQSSDFMEFFSPVRPTNDVDLAETNTPEGRSHADAHHQYGMSPAHDRKSSISAQLYDSPKRHNLKGRGLEFQSPSSVSLDEVFSPVRSMSSVDSSQLSVTDDQPLKSIHIPQILVSGHSLSESFVTQEDKENSFCDVIGKEPQVEKEVPPRMESVGTSTPLEQGTPVKLQSNLSSVETSQQSPVTPVQNAAPVVTPPRPQQDWNASTKDHCLALAFDSSKAVAAPVGIESTGGIPAGHFTRSQVELNYVRSCVADIMEEFQDEFRSRFLHMQYTIMQQSQKQQMLMEKLFKQYSLNEDLLVENERLREEIKNAKANY